MIALAALGAIGVIVIFVAGVIHAVDWLTKKRLNNQHED